MIKVGQVWETTNKYKVVVTSIKEEDYKGQVCIIYDDGYTTDSYEDNDFTFSKLLAEYQTWQEAVNSKEFNGEKNE